MTAFRRIPVAAIGTLVLSAFLLSACHYGHRYHGGYGYYPKVYAHPHKPHRYHHRHGYRYRHY